MSEELVHAERQRLEESARRRKNWKRWGPYLSEREWGTVREDYSAAGSVWDYFTHDQARSRAYRWGEDGLLGICDREGRLCFALALWNGRDPILKERLFGLTNTEGNHGEDVKECYFYLDSTPTHSYMRALYKYPQAAFPYGELLDESRRRGQAQPEFDLEDTGIFDSQRYFDVFAEYAKAGPNDILIRIRAVNRGPATAPLRVLPTLWFRNTWSWGRSGEGYWPKPVIRRDAAEGLLAEHASLGRFRLAAGPGPEWRAPEWLFTDNETNAARLFGGENPSPYVKDAFHEFVVAGRRDAVNPAEAGTKAAAHYALEVPAGSEAILRLRLFAEPEAPAQPFGPEFESIFEQRRQEADAFYAERSRGLDADAQAIVRQGYSGLLWSKQFYNFVVAHWLDGDPGQPPAPPERKRGRNAEWRHLFNRDVILMPDKWEYPWYASWDLAFHAIAVARVDPELAKELLVLLLREWYMHPSGKTPAYEFAFSDVNPPVHAWACWRLYKMTAPRGGRDLHFLARCFQKLLLNFTWWVNRKDESGSNLFGGGFLGLDNVGVFDRSQPLPEGVSLAQADGTAWMAFYCSTMLAMALELAKTSPAYEDMASKFFEHFVAITDAINELGGSGLWHEADGFYYDLLTVHGDPMPMRIRSMVGLVPLFAVENLEDEVIDRLPDFKRRMLWFLENRSDLARHIYHGSDGREGHRLLAIPSRDRLERVLAYLLDESEFLSPYGVRSLSRFHAEHPFSFAWGGRELAVAYDPAESRAGVFGGNSNWRGPVWFPVNFLLLEALERYAHFYGDALLVECPTGSGRRMNLRQVAIEIAMRLTRLLRRDAAGQRPCHGDDPRFAGDPHWRDLLLFHEFFDGDTGRGLGASHQTGWTALVVRLIEELAHAKL